MTEFAVEIGTFLRREATPALKGQGGGLFL